MEVPRIPKFKDLECLATNVYREARGEPMEGQIAVAKVTLNRVYSGKYPSSICGVVYQKNQFSWTSRYKNVVYNFPAINASVIAYNSNNDVKYTHFHVNNVRPSWRKQLKQGVVITLLNTNGLKYILMEIKCTTVFGSILITVKYHQLL